jgi:hypothetical protein
MGSGAYRPGCDFGRTFVHHFWCHFGPTFTRVWPPVELEFGPLLACRVQSRLWSSPLLIPPAHDPTNPAITPNSLPDPATHVTNTSPDQLAIPPTPAQ